MVLSLMRPPCGKTVSKRALLADRVSPFRAIRPCATTAHQMTPKVRIPGSRLLTISCTALAFSVALFAFAPASATPDATHRLKLAGSSAKETYRLGESVRLSWSVVNVGAAGCRVSSEYDGTIVFSGFTRDGSMVTPDLALRTYTDGLGEAVAGQLVLLKPRASLTIASISARSSPKPRASQTLSTVSWSPSETNIASIWPLDQPGRYVVTAVYSIPPVRGLPADTCRGLSTTASARFRVAGPGGGFPYWPLSIGGALGLLLLALLAVFLFRRHRRTQVARALFVLFLAASLTDAYPYSSVAAHAVQVPAAGPGAGIIVSGPPDFQKAVNDCFAKFNAKDGDPARILPIKPDSSGDPSVLITPRTEGDGKSATSGDRSEIEWSTTYPPGTERFSDRVLREPCAELYHELYHTADKTPIDQDCDATGIKTREVNATKLGENPWRAKHKDSKGRQLEARTAYGGVELPPSVDVCHEVDKPHPRLPGCGFTPGGANHDEGCGITNGDPHLLSFDGDRYDFQAVGEFVAMKSDSGSMEIQTRQTAYLDSTEVSVNSAVAMNVDGDRVGFYAGSGGIAIHLNGAPATVGAGEIRLHGGGRVSRIDYELAAFWGGAYSVTWSDGSEASVAPFGQWGLILSVTLSAVHRGHVNGLLGNFDGDSSNDLASRDGHVLPAKPSFTQLYQVFANSWRIKQDTSLFDYQTGETTDTFTNLRLPTRPIAAADLPNHKAAMAICRANGVTDATVLDDCALDIGITGQAAFSDSAIVTQEAVTTRAGTVQSNAIFRSTLETP